MIFPLRASKSSPLHFVVGAVTVFLLLLMPVATAMAAPAEPSEHSAAASVLPMTSTVLPSQLTDDADLLDDDAAQTVIDQLQAKYSLSLWVVTLTDSSATATEFAQSAWQASALGTYDAILVINTPDTGVNTFYFGADTSSDSPLSSAQRSEIEAAVKTQLSDKNYDGAISSVLTTLSTADATATTNDAGGSSGWVLASGLLGAAAIGAGSYAFARRRNKQRRSTTKSSSGAAMDLHTAPLAVLETQAGSALVQADDAVRSAAEELSYAQAQFGLTATDPFNAALARAQAHVTRSFELRKQLDDEIPETEPQQRSMLVEIMQRCEAAQLEIAAQEKEFSSRRGIEANLPASLAQSRQRADETEQAITAARTLLVTLNATYPPTSLVSISLAPDQADRLLAAGRQALDQAELSQQAGQTATAVEQVRIAQGSIAQAGQLAAQVSAARERLASAGTDLQKAIASISSDLIDAERLATQVPAPVLQPLVLAAQAAVKEGQQAQQGGDPLAALDHLRQAESALDATLDPVRAVEDNSKRAQAVLDYRLHALQTKITATTSFITTNRGAVGTQARTWLSEAARLANQAAGLRSSNPPQALQLVGNAEELVTRAQTQAEADVNNQRNNGGFGSNGGSGVDVAALLLGGLLLGGRGGYGGWGRRPPRGGFGGGHIGGGFGGGGLGGGGGRF